MAGSKRRSCLITAAIFSLVMPGAAVAHPDGHSPELPPWQQASPWPDRVTLTFEADPARSLAVNWRTDASVSQTAAEIALATADARFDLTARSVPAVTEAVDLLALQRDGAEIALPFNAGVEAAHYHSVRFDNLEPDTLYAYRVQGAGGVWSEWFHARTAPESGAFRFIYLGDAQNDILSHWSRTVRAAFQAAPDARFVLHAGDMVNRASRDVEWAEWFKASGFIHGMIPALPVAGNHEYDNFGATPETRQRTLSILWRPQFRLPVEESLPASLHETVYDVRYNRDLHIFILDTNSPDLEVQARWLDAELARSDAKWRIVSMHHPVFSSGQGRDNRERREAFLPIFLKHRVDFVLQGHDHTYGRGGIADDTAQTPERVAVADGGALATMFANSVSGPKQYQFKDTLWDEYADTGVELERHGENTQFYQVIDIDGDTLTYRAYTTVGDLYDSVTLRKAADGSKAVTEGNTSTVEARTFENTLPYPRD